MEPSRIWLPFPYCRLRKRPPAQKILNVFRFRRKRTVALNGPRAAQRKHTDEQEEKNSGSDLIQL